MNWKLAKLGIKDLEEITILFKVRELCGYQCAQLVFRSRSGFQLIYQRRVHLLDSELQRRKVNLSLRFVVEVDGSLCDACLIRDVIDSGIVESILKEGVRKKTLRNIRTEQSALAISDVIRGVVTHRVLGWSKSKISQDVDFIFDLIWKGIAAP